MGNLPRKAEWNGGGHLDRSHFAFGFSCGGKLAWICQMKARLKPSRKARRPMWPLARLTRKEVRTRQKANQKLRAALLKAEKASQKHISGIDAALTRLPRDGGCKWLINDKPCNAPIKYKATYCGQHFHRAYKPCPVAQK